MSNSDEMMIQSAKRVKLSECENSDRISDLSDCVILHILSFLNTKLAVQTCILSSRWKDIWKRLPALILHSDDFRTINIFTKYVSKFLSLRDSSIALHSLDLDRNLCIEPHLLKRIVNYAVSHNVQRFGLSTHCYITQIPPSIFSCQSLTYLKLSIYRNKGLSKKTLFPKSLNFPALTTLHLENFVFHASDNEYAEPFLALDRLSTLVLHNCTVRRVRGNTTLRVSSATLVHLTLHNQSKHFYLMELYTPSLHTFTFTGTALQYFVRSNLSSVKHVDIDAAFFSQYSPTCLLRWLVQFYNMKSLIVSSTTLQVLSLFPDLFKFGFRSLSKLKSLKVKTKPVENGFRMSMLKAMLEKGKSQKEAELETFSPIPDGMVEFLIQNSPLAEVETIDCSK